MRRLTNGDDIDQLFKDGLLRIEYEGRFLKVNKMYERYGFVYFDFKSGKDRMTYFYSKGGSRVDSDLWVDDGKTWEQLCKELDKKIDECIRQAKQQHNTMKQTVINLTEGMTAKVEGGRLIVSEPEKWTPKRGEVVNAGDGAIFLYKDGYAGGITSYACLYNHTMNIGVNVHDYGFKIATREERTEFFAALSKAGYKWNSKRLELKKVEKWAPKDGEFVIAEDGTITILGTKDPNGWFNILCRFYKGGNLDPKEYGHYTPDFISRPATESERATLLSALKKAGKTWNAKLKRVEGAPVKTVELTMEQICEKLGMNVKIVKK